MATELVNILKERMTYIFIVVIYIFRYLHNCIYTYIIYNGYAKLEQNISHKMKSLWESWPQR